MHILTTLSRLAAAAALAAAMGLAPVMPANAQSTNALGHFFDCLGSIFDQTQHDANCGPVTDPGQPPTSGAWGYEAPQPAKPSCPTYGDFRFGPADPTIIQVGEIDPCCASYEGRPGDPQILQASTCCTAYRSPGSDGDPQVLQVDDPCDCVDFGTLPDVWDPRVIQAATVSPQGGLLLPVC